MISIRRRGRVFYADYYHNGVRHKQSLHTRDGTVAAALARKIEREILLGVRVDPITWDEFIEEFLAWIEPQVASSTLKSYRYTAKRLGSFLKDKNILQLSEIDSPLIVAFMDMRRAELHPSTRRPMSDGGVKFELRVLKRIFSRAVEREYIRKNPVDARNLNSNHGDTEPFSQAEVKAMLADEQVKQRPFLHALILTFLYTGLRKSDVLPLRKDMVSGDSILVRTKKRGKKVYLKIHPDLRKAIDAHLAAQSPLERNSPFLFANDEGSMMRNNLHRMLGKIWKRAGISNAHPHRFRDTFAVRLLSKGASLYDVSKLLGISIQTAERHYAPFVQELQMRTARLIESLDFT